MSLRIGVASLLLTLGLGCGSKADSSSSSTSTPASSSTQAKGASSASAAAPNASVAAKPTAQSSGAAADPGKPLTLADPAAAPKDGAVSKNAVGGLRSVLLNGQEVETQAAAAEEDPVSGLLGGTTEEQPAQEGVSALAETSEFEGAEETKSAAPDQKKDTGFALFRRLDAGASTNSVTLKTSGVSAVGQGNWATAVIVMQGDTRITQSEVKRFKVHGDFGATGGIDFSLNPASGGLEKINGQVVFSFAAFKENGSDYELVNSVPTLIADVRYGQITNAQLTYISLLNGRVFRANGVMANTNQPVVTAVEFMYNSQEDCLFTRYVDFMVVNGRTDEGTGYEGCASVGGGEIAFNVQSICKFAPNNEPQCRKHNEAVSTKLVIYPYGIGLFGRIFREPGVG